MLGLALNREIECRACHKKVLLIVHKNQLGEIQDVRCHECDPLSILPEKCSIYHDFSQGEH
jgi:hypothetical protein